MLPQDITRWHGTARDNITLGLPATDEQVRTAAHQAGADPVLDALPAGLDTDLSPSFWGGRDLSGGQWQRIAAARAFLRTDARAEEAMYDRIRALAEGRTVVLITHRLGSTRHADRIIVLSDGRIAEEGDHATLLALGGEYAALWTTQARSYTTDAA